MIDMEDDIFDEVSEKVYAAFEKKCPDLLIMSEYVKSPSSFPFISIVEIDNATFRNSQTTEGHENHVAVTYEVNIYSYGRKCRSAPGGYRSRYGSACRTGRGVHHIYGESNRGSQ